MQDHGWSVEVKLAGPDAASVAAGRRQLEEQWLRVCPRVLFAWAMGEASESEESVFLVPAASALRFDPTPIATYWTNSTAVGARALRSWGGCVAAILLAAASYGLIVGSICAHDAHPYIEIAVHLVSTLVTLSVASSRFSRTLALQAVRYGDVWYVLATHAAVVWASGMICDAKYDCDTWDFAGTRLYVIFLREVTALCNMIVLLCLDAAPAASTAFKCGLLALMASLHIFIAFASFFALGRAAEPADVWLFGFFRMHRRVILHTCASVVAALVLQYVYRCVYVRGHGTTCFLLRVSRRVVMKPSFTTPNLAADDRGTSSSVAVSAVGLAQMPPISPRRVARLRVPRRGWPATVVVSIRGLPATDGGEGLLGSLEARTMRPAISKSAHGSSDSLQPSFPPVHSDTTPLIDPEAAEVPEASSGLYLPFIIARVLSLRPVIRSARIASVCANRRVHVFVGIAFVVNFCLGGSLNVATLFAWDEAVSVIFPCVAVVGTALWLVYLLFATQFSRAIWYESLRQGWDYWLLTVQLVLLLTVQSYVSVLQYSSAWSSPLVVLGWTIHTAAWVITIPNLDSLRIVPSRTKGLFALLNVFDCLAGVIYFQLHADRGTQDSGYKLHIFSQPYALNAFQQGCFVNLCYLYMKLTYRWLVEGRDVATMTFPLMHDTDLVNGADDLDDDDDRDDRNDNAVPAHVCSIVMSD
jgi:hypothetical protein